MASYYESVSTYDEFVDVLSREEKYIICDNLPSGDLRRVLARAHKAKLKGLSLEYSIGSTDAYTTLLNEVQDNIYLQELSIEAGMGAPGEMAVGLLLRRNKALKTLSLTRVQFTDTTFLPQDLQINNTLVSLHIWYTEITELGMVGLAEGLAANHCLKRLSLFRVNIWDAGALALAGALEVNSHLVSLAIAFGKIKQVGGIALARSLSKNTTLTSMNLELNELDVGVAHEFCSVLGVDGNRTLQSLRLRVARNDIVHDALVGFEALLQVNQTIEDMSCLPHNATTEETLICNRIASILGERRKLRHQIRLDAFDQALSSDQTTPWLRSKLMLVGRGAAGKTNTVRSLLGLPFNPEWDSTVGIDLTEVTSTANAEQSWEKANHNDFASNFVHRLTAMALEESEIGIQTETVLTEAEAKPQVSVKMRSTTTKAAKPNVVTPKEFEEPTYRYEEDLFMKLQDSKNAVRMAVWDYGGQTVFYTLHHLFLTQYGVYLIVFNLAKLLENVDESSEYLLFWLNSIKLHAPKAPVMLVGTFLDKLSNSGSGVESQLKKVSAIIQKLCAGFDQVCQFDKSVYCPISNKDKQGIRSLRAAVERETNNADFVQTPVSLRWMRALDILQSSGEGWIKVANLQERVISIGIEGEKEMEMLLKLFYELGIILYFVSSVRLREVVISKPEWLLQKLSLVIRDKEVHNYDTAKIHQVQLTNDLDYFLQEGIVSRDLLGFLWDKSQVEYLIELMRHLMLLSDWTFSEEQQYLIPSMVSSIEAPSTIPGVRFSLKFAFLPQGVFERLCCLCVGYSSSLTKTTSPKLYKTSCLVDLGAKGLILVDTKERNSVNVTLSEKSQASIILDFFTSMMRRIQHDFMHGGLEWRVWVSDGDKRVRYEDAQTKSLEPWIRKKENTDNLAIEKFLDM